MHPHRSKACSAGNSTIVRTRRTDLAKIAGTTFSPVTLKTGYDGAWQWGATQLAGWASTEFNAVTARYVKLQATSAIGNNVKINEVDVGGRLVSPIAN